MKIHFVLHEHFEGPAAIEDWAKNKGHELFYTRTYQYDRLPKNTDVFDFLVIMGEPQSPVTTSQTCAYFDSQAEQALIQLAILADKAVLGVCLGAQLIGDALGASFAHSPHKEIGVFNLELTEAGQKDSLLAHLPKTFPVAHWHGDMPGLTKDAQVLAISQGCPRQIIRYLPKVYGFQCHFEFTKAAIQQMVHYAGHELEPNKPYIQDAQALLDQDYTIINNFLFSFLDQLESLLLAA
jgi:GMP synthase (glutamine-hydrolysing)